MLKISGSQTVCGYVLGVVFIFQGLLMIIQYFADIIAFILRICSESSFPIHFTLTSTVYSFALLPNYIYCVVIIDLLLNY